MNEERLNIAIATVIIVAFLGIFGWGTYKMIEMCSGGGCETSTNHTEPQSESKPFTKTRCDFTGFMASSIIAEERANGYRFDGRVSTILCGENGLSFSLAGV